MTEVVLEIDKVPSIPDEKCMKNVCASCRHCYQHYLHLIILGIVVSIIVVAVGVIVIYQKPTVFPCYGYDSNTLASTVSVKCLQYIWDMSCNTKAPYTFPANYQGWWNQSPQGSILVSCHTSSQCGVGSYGNIAIYMGLCNIQYGQ